MNREPETTCRTELQTTWLIAMIVAATVLGTGLRFYHLDEPSLWEDELYSVQSYLSWRTGYNKIAGYLPIGWGMKLSGADFDSITHPDEKPRTFDRYPAAEDYQQAGFTAFRMRLGPAIIGILSIPILSLLLVRMVGARAAVIFALLLAASPWHVFWSQACRYYTQQFLFVGICLISYWYATERRSFTWFCIALVSAGLAYMTQPPAMFIAFVFAGDFAFGLIRGKPVQLSRSSWALGLSCVAIAACYVVYQYAKGKMGHWGELEGHDPIVVVLGVLWRNEIIVDVLAAAAVVILFRSQTRLISYLTMAAVLPVIVLVVIDLIVKARGGDFYIHTRYAFMVHFAWLLLAAMVLAWLYEKLRDHGSWTAAMTPTLIAMAMFGFTLLNYYTEGHGFRRRWAEAFTYVQKHAQPGEAIISKQRVIATYYMESTDIGYFPKSREAMMDIDEPTWIIVPMASARGHLLYPYVHRNAELKAVYDVRVLQPYSSVNVYYYDPARHGKVEDVDQADASP